MEIVRIGPELAKYVLEVDVRDGVVLPRFLRREAVARFISELPPLVVGMEACFGPRYWSKAFYQVSDVVGFGQFTAILYIKEMPRIIGFRFPRSVIGYAVWAYRWLALSLRDVEVLLSNRDVTVSYETICDWLSRFCRQFSARTRRDRPAPTDKWHLDEVVMRTNGKPHWLWRAVDTNGDVLDILVQSRRTKAAAKRFLRKRRVFW